MASGNGLPSSSALVVKRPSALGPFPRFVWIHQDTPRDSLDKTCHEIWKKVQDLPEALQPETSMEQLSALTAGTPRDYCLGFQEEAPELSRDRDEISLLVEQEFLSLTKEHLILVPESSEELKATSDDPQGTRELAPCVLAPLLVARSSECPGASLTDGDRLQEQKVAMSIIGRQQDCDSAMSTATGILCAAKIRGSNGMEDGDHSLGDCTSEISKLLTQFPLKSMEMSKAPDDKMVLKETRVIKDFLQNSIFSDSGPTEPMGLGPFRLVPPPPPPPPPDKLADELPAQKNQLPVFAKICSNTEADPATEGHHLIEWSPGIKESTKSQESLFLSQWPESQKDTCGEESHSDPVSTMPTKKPAWPDEKNLLCKFLGTTKNNPSGQLKLCNKVEVDALELKFNPQVMVAEKNNPKHTGNMFTPCFATALTSTTMSQPPWFNLNCPPPAVFANHSAFPQYQGMYPQQLPGMPYQQAVPPQLGCYSQQPNFLYPQRTPQKLPTNPRDPSPMAGDGPKYLFPHGYRFTSTSGGPPMNSPYFSSSGNGIKF
ncbi:hypothetical protein GW7_11519 [Heterocephalus glaber]|uniref:Uncharacterized protein n=1 Tax=Heterocephalus glaber TaxID=10181 RepID=G5B5L4_HETGA|nr:hypothetical protein GW7_11519 [Heterocephalus glaber]